MISGSSIVETGTRMECIDITGQMNQEIARFGVEHGLFFLFNPHTTAGLTINEGADPAVRADLITGLQQIVPMDYHYRHLEGNSSAHIMASLTGSSLTVAIQGGRLRLGTWQKLFFCEFDGPRTRTVHYHILSAA